jgi:predicted nucleotidyltransferase
VNTSLEHLPEHKQKQLREITGIIVKAVDPEKVILFGNHATGRWVEHRYTEGGITYEYISDYDILVITKTGESRKDYEVQDVIENRCVYKTPVTVITHDIDFVNKMLSEGQYFFTDIEKEGILLYDAGNTPLAERIDATGKLGNELTQKLNVTNSEEMLSKETLLALLNEDGQIFELNLLLTNSHWFKIFVRTGDYVDVVGSGERLPLDIAGQYVELDADLFR